MNMLKCKLCESPYKQLNKNNVYCHNVECIQKRAYINTKRNKQKRKDEKLKKDVLIKSKCAKCKKEYEHKNIKKFCDSPECIEIRRNEYNKQYALKRKDEKLKIKCSCGAIVGKYSLKRHQRTNKHIKNVTS